jgi:hypothetical protein
MSDEDINNCSELRRKGQKKIHTYWNRWLEYVQREYLEPTILCDIYQDNVEYLPEFCNNTNLSSNMQSDDNTCFEYGKTSTISQSASQTVKLSSIVGTSYYYMYIIDNIFEVCMKLGIMSYRIDADDLINLKGDLDLEKKLKEIAYDVTVKRFGTYYTSNIDPVIIPLKSKGRYKETWIQQMVSYIVQIIR